MLRDRVQQTTSTSGLGALALDGVVNGYVPFSSAYASGKKVYACCLDGNNWELFEGTLTSGSPNWTISRDRTLASSAGSPISFTGSAKQIFATEPAELLGPLLGRLNTVTTTNTGNAFVATYDVNVPVLIDGMRGCCRMNAAPTGAVTLQVNGTAAKSIKLPTGAVNVAAAWKANQEIEWRYDATADVYVWLNAPEYQGVKIVSATTYTVLAEDDGVMLRFTSATGCAVTLPQALATNSFASPWFCEMVNDGGASATVTITPTTSTIDGGTSLAFANKQGMRVASNGTNYFTQRGVTATGQQVKKSQTVTSGPIDANGLPSFGGSTGSSTVTATGTLTVSAANGFGAAGSVDRVGQITNPSWTGLSANGTMYLFLDVAADGTCTTASATLAPAETRGGTPGVTNGQFTFDTEKYVGFLGNGSSAPQAYRVPVGEVTVAGAVVTAITWYAINGQYEAPWTNTLPGTATKTTASHNIGSQDLTVRVELKNLTTEKNYAVGDVTAGALISPGAGLAAPVPTSYTRLSCWFTSGSNAAFNIVDASTGVASAPTAANWAYRMTAIRNW